MLILGYLKSLDDFVKGVKVFKNTLDLEETIIKQLNDIITLFSFYNKIYLKFDSTFKLL